MNSWQVLLTNLVQTCCESNLCRCSWEEFGPCIPAVAVADQHNLGPKPYTDGGPTELLRSGT